MAHPRIPAEALVHGADGSISAAFEVPLRPEFELPQYIGRGLASELEPVMDQQIDAAQSAFDAVQAEAELGSRTPLDVLDAEQALLDARASRIVAGANLQIAAYALLESTGQMTVTSLGLGIATYDVEAYSSSLRHQPARAPSAQGAALDRILGRYSDAD